MLALLPAFLLKFLGSGVIQSVLDNRLEMSKTATAAEKNRLDADVQSLQFELQRRQAQRDLQIKELEHPWLFWPKFVVMMVVALYVAARFTVKTWGLSDFGVVLQPLDAWEQWVAYTVMGYMFLGKPLERYMGKPQ